MVLALARPEVHDALPAACGRSASCRRSGWRRCRAARPRSWCAARCAATSATRSSSRSSTRADGNAFYLEELIRAAADGRGESLPESVLGMVQARLDAEDPEARRVLRAASVFGERFSRAGVAALLGGEATGAPVGDWIDLLCARELVARSRSPDRRAAATSSSPSRTRWCARPRTRC